MLNRLIRPMKRSGSSNQQFAQRIPADVRSGAIGLRLVIPLSNTESATVRITKDRGRALLAANPRACRGQD
jgi:hypothetical protein